MGRAAAVALATLSTLLATACAGGPDGSKSTGSLDALSALAGTQQDGSPASTVTSVSVCLAGARQRDNPDALSTAMERYGVASFETFGAHPAWTDPVECGEPHEIEVYGLVSLPEAVDSEIRSYASIVDPGTRTFRDVDAAVDHACAPSFGPAGAAMKTSGLDVDVQPAWAADVAASLTWAPMPPSAWDAGDRTFACLFEQAEPGTVRLSDVASGAFPSAGRICLMQTAFVPCGHRHDAERIAILTVNRAVERGQIVGAAAVDDSGQLNLGTQTWTSLDRVCERYLDAAAPRHPSGLRGVANTYPELYPGADETFTVLCSAQAPFGSAPSRAVVTKVSVFGSVD
jgi:hypothetical protein